MKEPNKKQPWFQFMATDEWVVFMNIMRIITLILVCVFIYILLKEIEAVKLVAYDACQICMNKTGATCFLLSS